MGVSLTPDRTSLMKLDFLSFELFQRRMDPCTLHKEVVFQTLLLNESPNCKTVGKRFFLVSTPSRLVLLLPWQHIDMKMTREREENCCYNDAFLI